MSTMRSAIVLRFRTGDRAPSCLLPTGEVRPLSTFPRAWTLQDLAAWLGGLLNERSPF